MAAIKFKGTTVIMNLADYNTGKVTEEQKKQLLESPAVKIDGRTLFRSDAAGLDSEVKQYIKDALDGDGIPGGPDYENTSIEAIWSQVAWTFYADAPVAGAYLVLLAVSGAGAASSYYLHLLEV